MQKQTQNFRWRVTHKAHGTVEVEGIDRLRAIIAAAMTWKQRWTLIARACETEKLGASVTRKQGCSSCAWAFREEQPGGMTALRCGYRAGAAEQTPPRSDGIRMLQPSTCYGRITQLFPTRMDGCADGRPPAWCRGYFIQKEH